MPKAAEPHRDFDRVHFHFQFNIWFAYECNGRRLSEYTLVVSLPMETTQVLPPIIVIVSFKIQIDIGDCVMFHSEHLHTSPLAQGLINYRRHSYDFRVVLQH